MRGSGGPLTAPGACEAGREEQVQPGTPALLCSCLGLPCITRLACPLGVPGRGSPSSLARGPSFLEVEHHGTRGNRPPVRFAHTNTHKIRVSPPPPFIPTSSTRLSSPKACTPALHFCSRGSSCFLEVEHHCTRRSCPPVGFAQKKEKEKYRVGSLYPSSSLRPPQACTPPTLHFYSGGHPSWKLSIMAHIFATALL